MTIEMMRERKRELGYTNEMLAEKSGVPLGTVQKIFGGTTKAPRRKTLILLELALNPIEYNRDHGVERTSLLREPGVAYGAELREKQDGYTIEDYYALPDEQRVELIDGVFYDLASPTAMHQLIMGEIYYQLRLCMKKHNRKCRAFFSPVDVQLDQDNKTMVQPDLLVICDRDEMIKKALFGAPDYIVEVLSPSTRRKDMGIKLKKYQEAGVREYWIVDPKVHKVVVYDFEHDDLPAIYPFSSRIPLRISEGKCEIDFAEIESEIEGLPE